MSSTKLLAYVPGKSCFEYVRADDSGKLIAKIDSGNVNVAADLLEALVSEGNNALGGINSNVKLVADILGDSIRSEVYGILDDNITSLPLKATNDGYLRVNNMNNITGFALESTQALIKAKTDLFQFETDVSENKDLRVQVMNSTSVPVSLTNEPTVHLAALSEVSLASGTIVGFAPGSEVSVSSVGGSVSVAGLTTCDTSSIGGTVAVSNVPSGHLDVYVVNSDQSAPINVNGTVAVSGLTTCDTSSIGGTVTVSNVPASHLDVYVVNSDQSAAITITNPIGQDLSVNVANQLNISGLATTAKQDSIILDLDGIKTAVEGTLSVNVSNQLDISGLATTVKQDSMISDLDGIKTAVQGTLAVASSNANPVFVRPLDASNVQVCSSLNVVGPQQLGSVSANTDGFLWVSAFISCPTSVSGGGTIYLEYSPDDVVWARASDSVFVMSSGSAVNSLIKPSAPCPFKYARLYADTGFSSSSVNGFICLK